MPSLSERKATVDLIPTSGVTQPTQVEVGIKLMQRLMDSPRLRLEIAIKTLIEDGRD